MKRILCIFSIFCICSLSLSLRCYDKELYSKSIRRSIFFAVIVTVMITLHVFSMRLTLFFSQCIGIPLEMQSSPKFSRREATVVASLERNSRDSTFLPRRNRPRISRRVGNAVCDVRIGDRCVQYSGVRACVDVDYRRCC